MPPTVSHEETIWWVQTHSLGSMDLGRVYLTGSNLVAFQWDFSQPHLEKTPGIEHETLLHAEHIFELYFLVGEILVAAWTSANNVRFRRKP